jgi:HK97 gp10 family phage protein
MKVSMTCIGHIQVANKMVVAREMVKREVPNAVTKAAFVVERRAKLNVISKHIIDTGALLNNIRTVDGRVYDEKGVDSGQEYSIYNEYGTSKMPARPYMRPAMIDSKADIEKLLGEAVAVTIASAFG